MPLQEVELISGVTRYSFLCNFFRTGVARKVAGRLQHVNFIKANTHDAICIIRFFLCYYNLRISEFERGCVQLIGSCVFA